MNKVLLVDIDGVVLNWNSMFDEHMIRLGHTLKEGYDTIYHLPHRYDVEDSQMHEIVFKFNTSHAICELPAYKDALVYIPKLKKEGFEIHAITCIGDHRVSRNFRKRNLKHVFGKDVFTSVICAPMYSCKGAFLEQWKGTGYVWVEDTPKHAQKGLEMGLNPYIIPHSYNQGEYSHIPRVSHDTPWYDLYHIIQDYYSV